MSGNENPCSIPGVFTTSFRYALVVGCTTIDDFYAGVSFMPAQLTVLYFNTKGR